MASSTPSSATFSTPSPPSSPSSATPLLQPSFRKASAPAEEPPAIATVIKTLGLLAHPEGGYFAETDRHPWLVPSPFPEQSSAEAAGPEAASAVDVSVRPGFQPGVRNASTTIYYLLTPARPQSRLTHNRGRTVHTLHRGRGVYVIVHADEAARDPAACRVEAFVVGPNVARGERLQWVVPGGKYKASFLLPDEDEGGGGGGTSAGGLLVTETVVPGFEYSDCDFATREGLHKILGEERAKPLEWLLT